MSRSRRFAVSSAGRSTRRQTISGPPARSLASCSKAPASTRKAGRAFSSVSAWDPACRQELAVSFSRAEDGPAPALHLAVNLVGGNRRQHSAAGQRTFAAAARSGERAQRHNHASLVRAKSGARRQFRPRVRRRLARARSRRHRGPGTAVPSSSMSHTEAAKFATGQWVEQFLQVNAEPLGKGRRTVEAVIGTDVRPTIGIAKFLGDELLERVPFCWSSPFFFFRRQAAQALFKTRFVTRTRIDDDLWALPTGRFPRLPHQLPFALRARTVFGAVRFVHHCTHGCPEPGPEDKDGDVHTTLRRATRSIPCWKDVSGCRWQVFPKHRLQFDTPGITPPAIPSITLLARSRSSTRGELSGGPRPGQTCGSWLDEKVWRRKQKP